MRGLTRLGCIAVIVAAMGIAGCASSAQHGMTAVVPAVASAAPAQSPDARTGSVTLRIAVPTPGASPLAAARAPKYISPATKSIQMTFLSTAGSPSPAPIVVSQNLTTGSPGCVTSFTSPLICTVTSPALAPGSYTGTFKTYDGLVSGGTPTGNVLSNNVLPVSIVVGQSNTINVVLAAVPAAFSVSALGSSTLTGTLAAGYSLSACQQLPQTLNVAALDADNNFIVGPGAPTISLTSGITALTVAGGTASAPNTFTLGLAQYTVPTTTSLTATATYNPGTGSQTLSSVIPLAILPGACGGIPASIAISGVPSATAGTPLSATPITVTAKDAGGYVIAGPYPTPITVSTNDASGPLGSQLQLNGGAAASSVMVTNSSDVVSLVYGGLANSSTITAVWSGISLASVPFAPTLVPIAYSGPRNASSLPEIDLYASTGAGSTAAFAPSEPGLTSFGRALTVDASSCATFLTASSAIVGSVQTVTLTAVAAPIAGTCSITVTDGLGQTLSVIGTYTSTAGGLLSGHRANH